MLPDNFHRVQRIALVLLGLNLLHDRGEVRDVLDKKKTSSDFLRFLLRRLGKMEITNLLRLGPLLLRKKLVLIIALDSTADAVDAVVAFLW